MYSYIAKSVFNNHLGSSNDGCYIQNHVITNHVIKWLRCTLLLIATTFVLTVLKLSPDHCCEWSLESREAILMITHNKGFNDIKCLSIIINYAPYPFLLFMSTFFLLS